MRMSKIVELPCGIGDSIFYIHRTVQGNDYILKVNVLAVIVAIYDDTKKIYLKIIYEDADGYTDRATAIYGVNAFSSREEAELKIKELSKWEYYIVWYGHYLYLVQFMVAMLRNFV